MKILVLNAGSSSLKWNVFDANSLQPLLEGLIEAIGKQSKLKYKYNHAEKQEAISSIATHSEALEKIMQILQQTQILKDAKEIALIGHRVVHGGFEFEGPVLVTDEILTKIEKLCELAPLHNPVNLKGIKESIKLFGKDIPQVAVFDTAFHLTMPAKAYHYAIPKSISDKIRKYGFHGTSHEYVSKKCKEMTGANKLISLHLGNGCSACAILNGASIDTSMGLTPLQGLVMGTRSYVHLSCHNYFSSGDLDPSIILHMLNKNNEPISAQEAERILNYESGLKGLCGENDMRNVLKKISQGDSDAQLALDVFVYRIQQYIGSYFVALGGCDALVFTAGIGEHAETVRKQIVQGIACLGAQLDDAKNDKVDLDDPTTWSIHTADSKIQILVIPTREEQEIAWLAKQIVKT